MVIPGVPLNPDAQGDFIVRVIFAGAPSPVEVQRPSLGKARRTGRSLSCTAGALSIRVASADSPHLAICAWDRSDNRWREPRALSTLW